MNVESDTMVVSVPEMVVSAKKRKLYGDPSIVKVKPTVFGCCVSKSKNRTMTKSVLSSVPQFSIS